MRLTVCVKCTKKHASPCGTDGDFCSAEGAIRLCQLRLNPFHHAVIVEDVLAGCFTDHCRRLEIFYADGARFLVLFELGLRKLLARQGFSNQSQLLLILLLKHALGRDRVMNTINYQVGVINGIISFGTILAEDAETGTAAKASES